MREPEYGADNETVDAVGSGNPGKVSGQEDLVPMACLAMPDESEQMQEPAVGDKVQYNCEGEITRIEGDQAYVKRSAINGHNLEGKEAPKDEMAELETMAANMPERE